MMIRGTSVPETRYGRMEMTNTDIQWQAHCCTFCGYNDSLICRMLKIPGAIRSVQVL